MKNIIFTIAISFIISLGAHAQSDSINFVQGNWEKKKIKNGVWWKHREFKGNLFSSNQYVNVVEIKNRGRRRFDLGYEKTVLKPTSDFGKEWGAIAALNGSFFDIKNGGSVDFMRSDGQIINENRLRE